MTRLKKWEKYFSLPWRRLRKNQNQRNKLIFRIAWARMNISLIWKKNNIVQKYSDPTMYFLQKNESYDLEMTYFHHFWSFRRKNIKSKTIKCRLVKFFKDLNNFDGFYQWKTSFKLFFQNRSKWPKMGSKWSVSHN